MRFTQYQLANFLVDAIGAESGDGRLGDSSRGRKRFTRRRSSLADAGRGDGRCRIIVVDLLRLRAGFRGAGIGKFLLFPAFLNFLVDEQGAQHDNQKYSDAVSRKNIRRPRVVGRFLDCRVYRQRLSQD